MYATTNEKCNGWNQPNLSDLVDVCPVLQKLWNLPPKAVVNPRFLSKCEVHFAEFHHFDKIQCKSGIKCHLVSNYKDCVKIICINWLETKHALFDFKIVCTVDAESQSFFYSLHS